jgi:hypothetical protein
MSGVRGGALGDTLRAADKLETQHPETLVRLAELMLAVEPGAADYSAVPLEDRGGGGQLDQRPRDRRRPRRRLAPYRRALRRLAGSMSLQAGLFSALVGGAIGIVIAIRGVPFAVALGVGVLLIFASVPYLLRIRRRAGSIASQLISREAVDPPAQAIATPLPTLDPPISGGDLPVDPLLLPRWTPGILATALSIESADGPPDVERIVDDMARLKVPSHLPRRRRHTLDRGAIVLVDVSEGMIPLIADTRQLLERVRRIVGPAVTAYHFDGRPQSVGAWLGGTGPADPLQTRRAVLAITNFGLFGPELGLRPSLLEREWLELAARLRRGRCPIVALVPLETRLVPASLRRHIPVIEWDRSTTMAEVARAVRR